MACPGERRPQGVFECQLCGLAAPYSHVGQRPPGARGVVLLEEGFVLRDPFGPDKDRFLVVGARCGLCGRPVCVGAGCSLFYWRRFCLPCVWENLGAFPREIRRDVEKRRPGDLAAGPL